MLQVKAAEKAAVNVQKKLTTHALPIRQYLVSRHAISNPHMESMLQQKDGGVCRKRLAASQALLWYRSVGG